MASLEKRGRTYRIVFRYLGEKYARGLSTRSEVAARALLARVEDNLYRLELGTLTPPSGGDLVSFFAWGRRRETAAHPAAIGARRRIITADVERAL